MSGLSTFEERLINYYPFQSSHKLTSYVMIMATIQIPLPCILHFYYRFQIIVF